MKKPGFFFCLLFLSAFSLAQEKRNSESYTEHVNFRDLASANLQIEATVNRDGTTRKAVNENETSEIKFVAKKIMLQKITPFLSFSCAWNETNHVKDNSIIYIRFSKDPGRWDEWIEMKEDEHYEKGNYTQASQLLYLNKAYRYYEIRIISNQKKNGELMQYLFLNFFSPGDKGKAEAVFPPPPSMNKTIPGRVTACTCPQPSFVSRTAWNCPQAPWTPSTTAVTHLIVHHSAGPNTASDWGAVVLSIWNFHTGTNGYSDIGYNWLIAPDGVVYEGRYKSSTEDIQGAHFCGLNGNTMGVCMLGTFTNQTITAAAGNSLIKLLAWKTCQRNIDPTALSFHIGSNTTINNVSGHRQGCATECPGNLLYADLPGIRTAVQSYSDNGCTLTPVTDMDGLEEFSLSPNPTTGTIYLKLKLNAAKDIQYRIIATDGKIIHSSVEEKLTGVFVKEIMQLQNLPKGIYLIQVWVNGKMMSKKIIRQ